MIGFNSRLKNRSNYFFGNFHIFKLHLVVARPSTSSTDCYRGASLMFKRKGTRAFLTEKPQSSQSIADADHQQRRNSPVFSPDNVILMQRTIGNQALTRLLNASQTKRVNGRPVHARIQRALIDGTSQTQRLGSFMPRHMDNETSSELNVAFIDFAALMQRNTSAVAGENDQAKGETFFADVESQRTIIDNTSRKFLAHQKHKKLNITWLKTLIDRDIPETRAAARWVQHNFATHPNSTYLNAMTAANNERKTLVMDYVKDQSIVSWDQMSDAQKQLLANNRDIDAARIAAIRTRGQAMMAEERKPREILDYMAKEVTRFVQDVVKEFVAVSGLEQRDLAVVSTGSFGSGELFPYSDVDVQIMTSSGGRRALGTEQMLLVLHNIRQRVRIANTVESTGQWKQTMGWDVDQLVQNDFTPETVIENDSLKGLTHAGLLYSTRGGNTVSSDLKARLTAIRKDRAMAKMTELFDFTKSQSWAMRKSTELDAGSDKFDFKEKFMRLPKIFLNVLAMYYDLKSQNSWDRVDELAGRARFSDSGAKQFREYLNIVSLLRLKYQFFYQQDERETVSPTPGLVPSNPVNYPQGYYTLTDEDRAALKKAQQIQQEMLIPAIKRHKEKMESDPV
jgi:hypothetical protein